MESFEGRNMSFRSLHAPSGQIDPIIHASGSEMNIDQLEYDHRIELQYTYVA